MMSLGALLLLAPHAAQSQVGGLINKRLPKPAGQNPTKEAVQFDANTLEITPERIDKLVAGLKAGKPLAEGPNGPAALRAKAEQVDERQAAIYNKSVNEIQKWDEKRMAVERCRDSVLSAMSDKKRMNSAQDMQKMQQIGLAIAMAQSKGDTAEVRRLTEQFQKSQEPTPADTATAKRQCGDPTPPAVVKEWLDLKSQIESLKSQAEQAEANIDKAETQTSGMNRRQRSIFCERIKLLIARLKAKRETTGFSDAEVEAAKKREQAIKDLEALCP
jgi:hypothetical protein